MEYFKILDSKENLQISNVPLDCLNCFNNCSEGISITDSCCSKSKRKRYLEHKGNNLFYFCSDQKECLGSNKIFKSKVKVIKEIIPLIGAYKVQSKQELNNQNKRINHNVVSLNAHNIQELYALVSDKILSHKLDQQRKIIRKAIEDDIDAAVSMFLRIAKNNLAIQTNFNVFNKLSEPNPLMNYRKQKIRRVFLAVYHVFFQDFLDQDIKVIIEETELEFFIDYESISVAFYHLLDNATKYALKGSTIQIKFQDRSDYCSIIFCMESLEIIEEEKLKLIEEGFKGEMAKKIDSKGNGIGMFIIDQLLKLNNGRLVINTNLINKKKFYQGIPYCTNEFVILLPKLMFKPR